MRTLGSMILVLLFLAVPAATRSVSEISFADVEHAVERTIASDTMHLTASVTIDAPSAGEDPLPFMEASGQTGLGAGHRAWLVGTVLELGDFSYIADGTEVYLRASAFDASVGPGNYLFVDMSAPPPGFEELYHSFEVGNDAALALYWLLGIDGRIEPLGSDRLDGVEVQGMQVPIDLELVRSHVPHWLAPTYERNLDEMRAAGAEVRLAEAWFDDDGLIRRIAYDMPVTMAGTNATMRVVYGLSGFGEPIDLPLPAPASTVEAASLFDR